MALTVGIDLGTTNSLIGIVDAGFPILIARERQRLTPSAVYFPPDADPIVGRAALRMRTLHPERTITSIKRWMGRGIAPGEKPPAHIRAHGRNAVRAMIDDRQWAPEEISALILKKLKQDAEAELQQEIGHAVITVPAYFNDAQRQATKTAGELAGFNVERILSEPTAAALAYGLDRLGEHSRVAVYDLGGGTFDISILELGEKVFQVISTSGNTQLGGDDIDRALFADVMREFAEINAEDAARLSELLIDAKHRLSTEQEVRVELPFAAGAQRHVATILTRSRLEEVAAPIVESTRAHCLRALADARMDPRDLDAVVLVGGATRMPIVQRFVRELFGREPDVSQNPDEAVALGATIQAGLLSGAMESVLLLDVTPLSLGIETFGGLMNVIIPRNSTIPIKAGEMFTNAVANQSSMQINVLQGERELARDNWLLGSFTLPFSPAPKGHARVGVQFEIDANGILHVLARDTQTGGEEVLTVRSAVDVSDEAVEKMIADSIEHAWDDMTERRWTEARIKSDELLPAVRNALEAAGEGIDTRERAEIARLVTEVEAALASHNVERLRAANAALDAGTEHLAAVLIERALGEGQSLPTRHET
jgi:molecular chaperone DnaK